MKASIRRRAPGRSRATAAAIARDEAPTDRYLRKREDILGAAALTFNELGIGGGTLRDIADRVGLATNSVTYYYRRKEDLASACFLRSIAAHGEIIRKAALRASVAERVEAYLVGEAEMLAAIAIGEHPPVAIFSEVRNLDAKTGAEVHDAYIGMFREVRRLLVGPETSALGRTDLNARTHMLLSAANLMRVWINRAEPDQYARIGTRTADIVVNGIGSPRSRWPADAGPELHWVLVDAVDAPSDRFLRVATDLLNEKGYHGASVDRISARLNVTKGSFYHYIEHKDDLILACFERTLTAIRRAATEAEALPVSGWHRVCAMSRAIGRLQVSAQGPLLRVGVLGALPAFDGRAHAYRRMFQLADRIGDLIVTGMVDGSIRPLDSGIAAQVVNGSVNAIAELHHWLPSLDRERLVDPYLKPVFEGLLAPPA